jgi:hypothetical protein
MVTILKACDRRFQMVTMQMSHSERKNWLLMLIFLNICISLGHYIHNILLLPEYHEPSWITPVLIDSLWFVMTPFSCIGYVMFSKSKLSLAYALLYVYSGLSLLVLGHYLIAPIWILSLSINLVIFAAAILAMYVFWLQTHLEKQPDRLCN